MTARNRPAIGYRRGDEEDGDDDEGGEVGQLPIDMTTDEAIKQLIRDEETRRNSLKRGVLPNPTAAELASMQLLSGVMTMVKTKLVL